MYSSNQWDNDTMQQNNNLDNIYYDHGYEYNRPQICYELNESTTFSRASLILGILAIILCCCFGWALGTLGIIFGSMGIIKEPRGVKIAIAGIIISLISVIPSAIFTPITCVNIRDNIFEDEYKEYKEDDDDEHLWGTQGRCKDNSVMYFNTDSTFEWLLEEGDYENIKSGTFELKFGDSALSWLVDEHPEYGITQEELEELWKMNNSGDVISDLYTRENLTVLILNVEVAKVDGVQQNTETYTVYYSGHSNKNGFDGANLNTFNYITITFE